MGIKNTRFYRTYYNAVRDFKCKHYYWCTYKHWRRINKLRDVWQSLLQNFLKWKDKTPVFVLRDLIQSWVSSHPGSLLSHPGSRGGQTGDLLGMSCRIRQRALVSGTSVFPIDEQKWHFPEVVDNIWHRQKVLLPSESSSQQVNLAFLLITNLDVVDFILVQHHEDIRIGRCLFRAVSHQESAILVYLSKSRFCLWSGNIRNIPLFI